MLDFKLFNIPVRVEPWFWAVGFFLGNGFGINSRDTLISTLLWIIVVFISIMIHEFGHALTSRKLTKVNPSVKLWAMGGLAYPNTNLSRKESFWVTWAGPLAGLGFFAFITLASCITYGFGPGSRVVAYLAFPKPDFLNFEALNVLREMHWVTFQMLYALIFVNFWWSLVNLLPVFPLDGGQIYASIENSQRKVFQVGLIAGVAAALAFLAFQRFFPAALFGYLAYQNYQRLQQTGGGVR